MPYCYSNTRDSIWVRACDWNQQVRVYTAWGPPVGLCCCWNSVISNRPLSFCLVRLVNPQGLNHQPPSRSLRSAGPEDDAAFVTEVAGWAPRNSLKLSSRRDTAEEISGYRVPLRTEGQQDGASAEGSVCPFSWPRSCGVATRTACGRLNAPSLSVPSKSPILGLHLVSPTIPLL